MTLNVALGTIAPAVQSKSGDRGGKNAQTSGQGFGEALAGKAEKRSAKGAQTHQPDEKSPPALERFITKLGRGAEEIDAAPVELRAPDQNFDAILEGVLLENGQATSTPVVTDGLPAIDEQPDAGIIDDGEATPPALPVDMEIDRLAGSVEQGDDDGASLRMTTETGSTGKAAAETVVVKAGATVAATQGAIAAAPGVIEPAVRPARAGNTDSLGQKTERPGNTAVAPAAKAVEEKAPSSTPRTEATPRAATTGTVAGFEAGGNGDRGADKGSAESAARIGAMPSTDPLAGRVNVVGFNAALAPSATTNPLLGTTAASVVAAMEGDTSWRSAAMEASGQAAQRGQILSSGVNTLRIQLHPIELGMVTARLTASGEQLSVEIQVESNDARQKLTTDSEMILKALRAVGYDVEKVTITQSSPNASGNGQQGATGRDQSATNQQAHEESGTRGQDGGRGGRDQNNEGARHGAGEKPADRAGGSLYI